MPYRVFLSHSIGDKDWAERIHNDAQKHGIEVYLFEYDPRPGKLVAGKIKKEIETCDVLVVLITHNSQHSSYVHQEIGFAEALSKLIIPLVQEGTPKAILGMLEGREHIQFNLEKPNEALSRLSTYLQKLRNSKRILGIAAIIGLVAFILLMFYLGRKS